MKPMWNDGFAEFQLKLNWVFESGNCRCLVAVISFECCHCVCRPRSWRFCWWMVSTLMRKMMQEKQCWVCRLFVFSVIGYCCLWQNVLHNPVQFTIIYFRLFPWDLIKIQFSMLETILQANVSVNKKVTVRYSHREGFNMYPIATSSMQ